MKIYESVGGEGYEWIVPANDADFEMLRNLGGARLGVRWRPLPVRLIKSDEGQDLKESDFPWLGHHLLVLSERAGAVVGPIVKADAELLPLAKLRLKPTSSG